MAKKAVRDEMASHPREEATSPHRRFPPGLSEGRLLELYRRMLLIRKFDETADRLFEQGLVKGTVHTSIGQEAVSVGVCACLEERDVILSTHRGHGNAIAKGCQVKPMMAELLGRRAGLCKGKGGSMHIADLPRGLYGANPIVGANIPIATGIALAMNLQKKPLVCVAFFGDGASNQGTFHEGLNLAAIWKVPAVFVCENNQYAVSVPVAKSTAVRDIAERAKAYDIPGAVVDGMDLLSVYEAARLAVERARSGGGPSLLEMKTYRFRGHSRGDPPAGPYRTKEELERWKARDPVLQLEGLLKLDSATIDRLNAEATAEIEAGVEFAKASEPPSPEEALEDVYA